MLFVVAVPRYPTNTPPRPNESVPLLQQLAAARNERRVTSPVSKHCRSTASRNLQIVSERGPENSPEFSDFLYLCGNAHCAGLVLQPLPVGAWAFLGLTVTVATKTLPFMTAFSAFRNEVIWLIVVSFYFAKGFEKCGLGDRIANLFVKTMGKSTLGLAYGLTIAEGVIAPAMPSTSARAGGIFMPIIKSLSEAAGSFPGETSKKLGSYLVFTIMHVRPIQCSLSSVHCLVFTSMHVRPRGCPPFAAFSVVRLYTSCSLPSLYAGPEVAVSTRACSLPGHPVRAHCFMLHATCCAVLCYKP